MILYLLLSQKPRLIEYRLERPASARQYHDISADGTVDECGGADEELHVECGCEGDACEGVYAAGMILGMPEGGGKKVEEEGWG